MTNREDPRRVARVGGALYLAIILLGLFEEVVVRQRIVVPGDALATAANLRSMELLWRLGIAAEVILLICAVVLALILYVLLRPVHRELALLAVLFNAVTIAVEAVGALNLTAALFPQGTALYLSAFSIEQLAATSTLLVRGHSHAFGIALTFFGCECLVVGYLIVRSGYLPKAIGVLMQIAGLSYLVNCFSLILAPGMANLLIMLPALIGEGALALWLLIRGVDEKKWLERQMPPRPA